MGDGEFFDEDRLGEAQWETLSYLLSLGSRNLMVGVGKHKRKKCFLKLLNENYCMNTSIIDNLYSTFLVFMQSVVITNMHTWSNQIYIELNIPSFHAGSVMYASQILGF